MDIEDEIDQLNDVLRPLGLKLDELIESGRAIRGELLRDMNGIDPDAKQYNVV